MGEALMELKQPRRHLKRPTTTLQAVWEFSLKLLTVPRKSCSLASLLQNPTILLPRGAFDAGISSAVTLGGGRV